MHFSRASLQSRSKLFLMFFLYIVNVRTCCEVKYFGQKSRVDIRGTKRKVCEVKFGFISLVAHLWVMMDAITRSRFTKRRRMNSTIPLELDLEWKSLLFGLNKSGEKEESCPISRELSRKLLAQLCSHFSFFFHFISRARTTQHAIIFFKERTKLDHSSWDRWLFMPH